MTMAIYMYKPLWHYLYVTRPQFSMAPNKVRIIRVVKSSKKEHSNHLLSRTLKKKRIYEEEKQKHTGGKVWNGGHVHFGERKWNIEVLLDVIIENFRSDFGGVSRLVAETRASPYLKLNTGT